MGMTGHWHVHERAWDFKTALVRGSAIIERIHASLMGGGYLVASKASNLVTSQLEQQWSGRP
jgi:hypothetical protein